MIQCQNCGSTKLYFQTEHFNDITRWNAWVQCSDCGEICDDDRAIELLHEAE